MTLREQWSRIMRVHQSIISAETAFFGAPKKAAWLDSVGQIDFYDDAKLVGAAADKAAEWFRKVD